MNRHTTPLVSLAMVLSTLLGAAMVLAENPPAPPPAPRPFTPAYRGSADSGIVQSGKVETTTVTTVTTVDSDLEAQKQLRMRSTGESSPLETRPTAAGTTTRTTQQTTTGAVAPAPFRAEAYTRKYPATGWSVGVYGGANLFQDANGEYRTTELVPGPPAVIDEVQRDIDEGSAVFATGGLKLRYTWPFDEEPIEQWADDVYDPIRLSGALEGEAGYVGSRIRTDAVDFNMNSALFMINAYLVGQTGKLRPYLGGGGGIALIFADNYSNAGLDDAGTDYDTSDDVVALAWQLIAGADYFLDNNWSVFAEYKYLVFTDFDVFNGQSEVQFGELDNHILNMGLRRNF